MKKRNIIKKNEDFQRIITTIKPYVFKDYILYIEKIKENNYYFGISISKKIGNAVTRNKIRRKIKTIIDKKNYQNNFNCIIMVKRSILNLNYSEMEEQLHFIFTKVKIIKEN